jgi:hypothetical protein
MLRGRALRVTGVPVLALTLFSACYRYVPMTGTELVPGSAFRGHLTPEGSAQVASIMGENVGRFDGRLITVSDSGYVVAMSATLKRSDQRATVWTGEQLVIPRNAVGTFELRELDRPRTARAAALYTVGLLAVGALVFSIKGIISGNPGTPSQPPPP